MNQLEFLVLATTIIVAFIADRMNLGSAIAFVWLTLAQILFWIGLRDAGFGLYYLGFIEVGYIIIIFVTSRKG